jgi:hypothetical protein
MSPAKTFLKIEIFNCIEYKCMKLLYCQNDYLWKDYATDIFFITSSTENRLRIKNDLDIREYNFSLEANTVLPLQWVLREKVSAPELEMYLNSVHWRVNIIRF